MRVLAWGELRQLATNVPHMWTKEMVEVMGGASREGEVVGGAAGEGEGWGSRGGRGSRQGSRGGREVVGGQGR